MPRTPRIAIIGGGIGGLAAALALEARGAEVIVAEKSSVLSEVGAGLNLSPNAVEGLPRARLREAGRRGGGIGAGFSGHPLVEKRPGHFAGKDGDYRRKIRRPAYHRAPRRPVGRF